MFRSLQPESVTLYACLAPDELKAWLYRTTGQPPDSTYDEANFEILVSEARRLGCEPGQCVPVVLARKEER